MRIDVSEPEQCGCVTCLQHRTSGTFNTQETEPSNVMFSPVTSIPVSSGPVQVLGDESSALGSTSTSCPVHSSSPISSGTETLLAPPVTTSADSEPAQSIDSTIFNWGVFKSENAPADASATSTSSSSSPVQSSSPTIFSFRLPVTPVSSEPTKALGPTSSGSLPVPIFGSPPPFTASGPSIVCSSQAPVRGLFGSSASVASTSSTSSPFDAPSPLRWGSSQAPVTGFFGSGASAASTSSASSPFDAPSPFRWGSMQPPVTGFFGSGASAASISSASYPFDAPSSFRWGLMQAPVTGFFGSGASAASTSSASSPFDAPSPFRWGSSQAPVTGFFGFGASAASTSSASSPFDAFSPFRWGSMQAPVTGFFCSSASAASTSSTSSPLDAPSPLRWGSMPPPVQPSASNTFTPFSFLPAQDPGKTASAFPSLSSERGDFARPNAGISPAISTPTPTRSFGEAHFSSPFGPKQDFTTTGISVPRITQKYPSGSLLPGFGYNYLPRYPSNLFGPNPQTTTPVSGRGSFFAAVETEQGSRYPRYAPTPDLDDCGCQGKMMISISASNSHRHKSHEELRWEDYKKGDKGGFGLFPAAHTSPFSSSTVSPSLFASPSIPDHPQRTTVGSPQGNMTNFPFGNTPTAVQTPHEPAGVSSPASGCTACGATSSSSPTGYLDSNVATNPPSAATSLPGLFFSTSGSCPLVFGTPNLAAQGTTIRSALQPYLTMFGTPNIAAQCTTTNPAVQAYPMMFGTPNLAAQCTTTNPAVQAYPMMFGTPNLAAQCTTTNPAVQAYPMMFGTPNLAAQCTTPAFQAYPVHGLILLPFAAMSLQ